MISGKDYKKFTRLRFILYALVTGPITGYALFWLMSAVAPEQSYETFTSPFGEGDVSNDNVMLFQLVYLIGFIPSLFTASYLGWHFKRREGLTNLSVFVLLVSFYGGVTLVFGLLAFGVMGADGAVVPLFLGLVSTFIVLSTLILWFVLPRRLIGPMTKGELAVWRREQDALNQ